MYEYETLSQVIYLLQVKMNCHYTIIKIIHFKENGFFYASWAIIPKH